jgi:hypothetical protein
MRILGKSIVHIQNAIDRAFLDIKYNGVWKYARMKQDDYVDTEFLVQIPQEGGYILDFLSKAKDSKRIVDRVSAAITQALRQATQKYLFIGEQVENRKLQLNNRILEPVEFKDILEKPNNEIVRAYGDRSIAKEIDQVLSTIRSDYAGTSIFVLTITGSSTQTFNFDKSQSNKFHGVVSRRNLSIPVIYSGKLQLLDMKNNRGKFINDATGKTSTLHLNSASDFLKVHPYLSPERTIKFIGCPLIEFGALEPYSGDVYFIDIIE